MGKTYYPKPFFRSIYRSDLEKVKNHIRDGVDVNKAEAGSMPLKIASGNQTIPKQNNITRELGPNDGRLQIVKELVHNGARINNIPRDNDENDELTMSQQFTKSIDDYDHPEGPFALQESSLSGYKEIVEFLLQHGANVNEYYNGETAIHKASFSASKDVVQVLIDHGADIHAKNDSGKTALHISANSDKNDVNFGYGARKIENSAYGEIVSILLRNGARVNDQDDEGMTALHYAAKSGNNDIINTLIKHGSSIDERNVNGDTALKMAIYEHNISSIEVLMKHGIRIEMSPEDQKRILQHMTKKSIGSNFMKTLFFLRENGLDVKSNGDQALKRSVQGLNDKMVFYLLKTGVKVGSLFDVARIEPDLADLVGMDGVWYGPTSEEILNVARYMIIYGSNIDEKNEDGKSVIEVAADQNNILLVRELIKYGSKIPPIKESWAEEIKKMISSDNMERTLEWFREDYNSSIIDHEWKMIQLQIENDELWEMKEKLDILKIELHTIIQKNTRNSEETERLQMIKNDMEEKISMLNSAIRDGKMDKVRLLEEIDLLSEEIIMLKRFTIGNKNSE